ncbi:MAG: hypothetical protein MUE52_18655 [Tabrizicola sp.]|jgi:hypothetical protein|nr:hypothetical protein [Tabrizicola sp.]
MIRYVAVCLSFVAGPSLAQAYTEDQKAIIVAAFSGNGCKMNETDAERLLPPLGISKVVFAAVIEDLEDAGQATWSDETETLSLVPEICK